MFGDKRWYLFTLFGHAVYLTPSFLFILILFVGMNVRSAQDLAVGLLWVPVLFLSILLHELGHAFASDRLGYGKSQIMFWGLGGVAINRFAGHRSPKRSILVSLAGPAVSLLLAVISGAALWFLSGGLSATNLGTRFLELMYLANAVWAVFNLLPIYPMDGGQAMRSGLLIALKDQARATRFTGIISMIALALAAVASFVVMKDFFLILLFAYFAYINWKLITTRQQVRWV